MLKKILHSLFAFSLLAASTPGFAMVCERPCSMKESQRLACVKACALAKQAGQVEIGKADCTRFEVQPAPEIAGFSQAQEFSPVQGLALPLASALQPARAAKLLPAALRGPPPLPSQVSLSIPSQNAPPVLI